MAKRKPMSRAAILVGMATSTKINQLADVRHRLDQERDHRAVLASVHLPDSGHVHIRNMRAWFDTAMTAADEFGDSYEPWFSLTNPNPRGA